MSQVDKNLYTDALDSTGTDVKDSKLFMKINSTRESLLGSLLTNMQLKATSELCLTTDTLSDLLANIKSQLLSAKEGEEVPSLEEAAFSKAAAKPSKKTLQKICTEVLQEIN